MITNTEIRILFGALEENEGGIIVRGVLDPASLPDLKVGPYQRESLSKHITKLAKAFRAGVSFPDIDLACRGGNYREDPDGTFSIPEDVYITDGQQRRDAAWAAFMAGFQPHLGAMVHFNTTEAWERKRFEDLNSTRMSMSPNVRLRNLVETNTSVEALHRLCHMRDFPLFNRVSWQQNMQRSHLVHATLLLKMAGALHAQFATGLVGQTQIVLLAQSLDSLMKKLGHKTLTSNLLSCWQFIDEAWQVQSIAYARAAAHLRQTFLLALADLLSWNEDFWNDSSLRIEYGLRKKLASFPIDDPTVQRLASSSGKSREHLAELLRDHVNSGKRTKRLTPINRPTKTESSALGYRNHTSLPRGDKYLPILERCGI